VPLDRKLLTKGRFRAHAHYAEREKALATTLETKRQNRTRAWKQSRTRAELALPASQRYGPAEPAGAVDPTAFDAAACDFRPLAPLPRFFAAAATKSTAAIANLSRPDVSLSWDRFVRGGATATKTLDDQTATFVDLKAVARAAPRRTLIFLATHGSACHLVHLQSCWPGALRRAPTLSRADVLLYVGASPQRRPVATTATIVAPYVDALFRLPNANVSITWNWWNKGYQHGAVAPMIIAARRRWFDGYEWIVRANPDVSLVDPAPLEARMASSASAVLFICGIRGDTPRVDSDFFAGRPELMDHEYWTRMPEDLSMRKEIEWSTKDVFRLRSAEWSTTDVFRRASPDATLWDHGPSSGCRVNAWGILHDHRHCRRTPLRLPVSDAARPRTSEGQGRAARVRASPLTLPGVAAPLRPSVESGDDDDEANVAWMQSRTRAELSFPASQRYGPPESAGAVNPTVFDADTCDFRPLAPLPRPFAAAAAEATAAIANLSRPDVSLSWEGFVRGGAHAMATFDDQTATFVNLKAAARPAPNRTLIFLATHASDCHLVHLQSCWPGALRNAATLSRADVLLFVGARLQLTAADVAPYVDALFRLENANVSLAWSWWNPDKQHGAVAPMVIAARRRWFEGYEWIVRANPDISLVDPLPLEARMASNTSAVLFLCGLLRHVDPRLGRGTPPVDSDFFAGRPELMDQEYWTRMPPADPSMRKEIEWSTKDVFRLRSAEWSTTDVFRRASPDATLWDHGPSSGCRVNAWGILHDHRHCRRTPLRLPVTDAARQH